MTDKSQILETIASDGDVQVEEFSREPLELVASHRMNTSVPSGVRMLANRNGVEISVASEYFDEAELEKIDEDRYTKIVIHE